MKKFNLFAILLIGILLASGCKKDDDDDDDIDNTVGVITVDNVEYDVESGGGLIQLMHDGNYTTGAITISGSNSSTTIALGFGIEYLTNDDISGIYENGDISSSDRIYDPWLCQLNIYKNNGSSSESFNSPEGSLSVTHNSNNNYTVKFNMTFADSINVVGDITTKFTVQNMSFKK